MKNWKVLWVAIIVLLIIVGVLAFTLVKTKTIVVVDNFETCVAAGYTVAEIYPRQCFAPDRSFTEDILPPPRSFPPEGSDDTVCTLEARLCSDGSYVSRTGPDCEFALCPGE